MLAFNNIGGIGRSGTGTFKVDGKAVSTQKMDRTYGLREQPGVCLMGKRRNKGTNGSMPAQLHKRRVSPLAGIVLMAAAAGAVGFGTWWHMRSVTAPATAKPAAAGVTHSSVPAQSAARFQKLKGYWVRPDGGYVVNVSDVDSDGKMAAAYYNPRSIHVAQARASQDGAATKVFIELRDVNYPGSTYSLTYNSQEDRLEGVYYQALLQQSFEVVFFRAN